MYFTFYTHTHTHTHTHTYIATILLRPSISTIASVNLPHASRSISTASTMLGAANFIRQRFGEGKTEKWYLFCPLFFFPVSSPLVSFLLPLSFLFFFLTIKFLLTYNKSPRHLPTSSTPMPKLGTRCLPAQRAGGDKGHRGLCVAGESPGREGAIPQ